MSRVIKFVKLGNKNMKPKAVAQTEAAPPADTSGKDVDNVK